MDTLSHALWGGLVFGKENLCRKIRSKKLFWAAFFFGAAPDIISFSPGFIHWALAGFPAYQRRMGEPPPLDSLPASVFTLYNITHSFILWFLIFALLWIFFKKPIWVFASWGLHILCDIPTHTTRYFPTPFLWPFPTPYVDGFRWATPRFMILNYSSILIFSLILYLTYRKKEIRNIKV